VWGNRLRLWFPPPLVAIVILQVVLIGLTPELLPGGSAGSLATEAELIVDRVGGENVTHFYVEGLTQVRYTEITLQLANDSAWPPPGSPTFHYGAWEYWNQSLVAVVMSAANPVALNVTSTYVDSSGASVTYAGAFEFNVTAGTLYYETYLPGSSGPVASVPLSDLPIPFVLSVSPSGGPP
jgi:hypothetical protein